MTNSFDPRVHAVDQPIYSVVVRFDDHQHQIEGLSYVVGRNGVTYIEAFEKNGEYCHLPYIRVWEDNSCIAEFSQHHVAGVFFVKKSEVET